MLTVISRNVAILDVEKRKSIVSG